MLRVVSLWLLLLWAECVLAQPRIVMITHGSNTDSYWNIVKNGALAAAADQHITLEYHNPANGESLEIAQLMQAALATHPDGLAISIPDSDALHAAIQQAMAQQVPLVSLNAGGDKHAALGIPLHIGQAEYQAGLLSGQAAKAKGVKHAICINHEVHNTSQTLRCNGYAAGLSEKVPMLDVGQDPIEVRNKVQAYLNAHPEVDGILALGPITGEPVLKALRQLQRSDVHFISFGITPLLLTGLDDHYLATIVDEQQYLQGYLAVTALALQIKYHLIPGGELASGPSLLSSNSNTLQALAGVIR